MNHFPIKKNILHFFTDIDNLLYPAQNVHIIFFQDNDCKCVYLFSISKPCDIPTKYRHKISTWWNYVNMKIGDVINIMLNIKMFKKSIFNKSCLQWSSLFLCQLVLKVQNLMPISMKQFLSDFWFTLKLVYKIATHVSSC